MYYQIRLIFDLFFLLIQYRDKVMWLQKLRYNSSTFKLLPPEYKEVCCCCCCCAVVAAVVVVVVAVVDCFSSGPSEISTWGSLHQLQCALGAYNRGHKVRMKSCDCHVTPVAMVLTFDPQFPCCG